MSAMLNTTVNGTQRSSCWNPAGENTENTGKTFAYCLILVFSLAGNSLLVIIVYKTKTMRKPINYLIVNMAMSDMLFPIFVFPQILTELYYDYWLISGSVGQIFCKLVSFVTDVSVTLSTQSQVLIAVDRFGAVVYPHRTSLVSSKLRIFILATWIIAVAVFFPHLFTHKLVEYPGGLVCSMQWTDVFGESSSVETYVVAVCVIFLYIPLVLIAVLYSITHFKLKSQPIPGETPAANAVRQRVKREQNVLKMTIAIVLVFAVCWLPITVFFFLILFELDETTKWSCGFVHFSFFAQFMAHANCAINPCICFIFSGNYRQGLKKLFHCLCPEVQVQPINN